MISLDTDYLHSRVLYNNEAVATVAIDPINFYIYFGTFHSEQLPFIGRVKLDGSGKSLKFKAKFYGISRILFRRI